MNGSFVLLRIHKDATKLHKLVALSHTCFHTNSSTNPLNSVPQTPELPLPLSSLQCGAILQSLTNAKSFKQGLELHSHIITSGIMQENAYLCTKLAAFYANCGHMEKAQISFDQIGLKSSFLWNFMIRGYASNGFALKAILLYRKMMSSGVEPDNFTYPFVVKACGDMFDVEIGRRVHAEIVINGFESDVYVGNFLLAMYVKFGDMENARLVFDRMPKRDLTSWNTMISGYAKNGCSREALAVFHEMQRSGAAPDSTTLLGMVSACSELQMFKLGTEMHGYVLRSGIFCSNNFLTNSFIEFYCSCNAMLYATQLFEMSDKDSVTWNTMISGYKQNGMGFEALMVFCRMVAKGEQTDLATILAVVGACEHIAALDLGMSAHSYLVRKGFGEHSMAATALISMYSQCGKLSCARCVFDEILEKNLVSWTSMISAYGRHGKGKEAISIFHQLAANGIIPDEGAFTSILTACSHAGLVEEGRKLFHEMHQKYNIKPVLAHYACFVDLLSRAGQLDEAYEIVCNMVVKPTNDIWASLLSGCRLHGNVTLAEVAGQKILEQNPDGLGGYICLSHVYADEKRWNDVEKLRGIIQNKRLIKPTGWSFIK